MIRDDVYERTFDEDDGAQLTDQTCSECGGRLQTDGGETACDACGLIVDEHWLDRGPEWTNFDADDERARTGAPLTTTRHDRGLSTEIGRWRDGNGNVLSGAKRRQLSRLRREHGRSRWASKREQNLAHGCGEVIRIASALDLPETIREQAGAIFRSAHEAELLRGRSIESIAAGSVYAACRCAGLPRSIEEVVAVAQCDQSAVENGYRTLNTELGLETALISPKALVPRLASDLGVPSDVQAHARQLAERADRAGLTNGRQPSGIAAAALYLACKAAGCDRSQAAIATVAGTTPATLRSRRDELFEIGEIGGAAGT